MTRILSIEIIPATKSVGRLVFVGGFHVSILSLYPRSELAKDAGVQAIETAGAGMSLGQLVDSREEVDRVLELARQAGGRVLGAAHERPWGIYSGYFADPDDHLWEIIYFPERDGSG